MEIQYLLDLDNLSPQVNLVHKAAGTEGIKRELCRLPCCELLYVLEGQGRLRLLEATLDFSGGDLIFIPPYLLHEFIPQGFATPHYRLQFNPAPGFQLAYQKYEDLTTGYGELRLFTNYQHNLPLLQGCLSADLTRDFEKLSAIHRQLELGRLAERNMQHQELVLRILRKWLTASSQERPLAKSILHIEEFFTSPLNLPFLAKMEKITPNYYSHLFKTHYSLSPVEYITQKRILLAKKLLADGRLKIKEIAVQTGFEDEYYFSKVFKKQTRCSPREYRKLLK